MSRTQAVRMPRLGESITEATITRWLIRPGETISELAPLVEVNTDKVSTEVPSPASGVVKALLAEEGQSVKVGAEIAIVEVADASPYGASSSSTLPSRAGETTTDVPRVEQGDTSDQSTASERHRYSPAVRELARTSEIDLAEVPGTGEGGRVTRSDVLAFIADRVVLRQPAPPLLSDVDSERIPLPRLRRVIAERMTLSKATIPHAWQAQEVDMGGVVANRSFHLESFKEREGFTLTYLPYVVAAAAAALRRHRFVNATFADDHLVVHRSINIGVAVGLEEGVVVPVIRDADGLSVGGIARAATDLVARAQEGRLTLDDLSSGTFTVNNSGTFGTLISYSVIAPGQAGILTMGAIRQRVVAVGDSIAIRPIMFLSFSLDHRILDGLQAARFLSSCREWLESVTRETSLY